LNTQSARVTLDDSGGFHSQKHKRKRVRAAKSNGHTPETLFAKTEEDQQLTRANVVPKSTTNPSTRVNFPTGGR
jgi:hypothetical protein